MANPQKLIIIILLSLLTGCSQFAIIMSGSSLAISQSTYAKIYNGIDVLTIMNTKKSIKGHAYDSAKKAWTETNKGKKYLYDKAHGLITSSGRFR